MEKGTIKSLIIFSISSTTLLTGVLTISNNSPTSNIDVMSIYQKELSVISISSTNLTLSNNWSPAVETYNATFDTGLLKLGPEGYIANIDSFQSIKSIEVDGHGDLDVYVSSTAYGEYRQVDDYMEDEPIEFSDDYPKYFKFCTFGGFIFNSLTFTCLCS